MAFSATALTADAGRPFSLGELKAQLVSVSAASGDTSGTLTAPSIANLLAVILPGSFKLSAATTFSANAATLAIIVPTATAATLTLGGVTYTAVAVDNTGNNIRVRYTGGATAGAEVVTVAGNDVTVQIEDGVSTITQVRVAFNLSAPAAALATATGTSGTAVSIAAYTALAGGITGGGAGHALLIGR